MDTAVKTAIENCAKILENITQNEDLCTTDGSSCMEQAVSRLLTLMKLHLISTAEVITNVLHKNNNQNGKKRKFDEFMDFSDDFLNFDSQIHEESKTTRRNAHYKSTVLVVFYYIIYLSYYGKPPKHIGYDHIIQNNQAKQYLEAHKDLMDSLYPPKKRRKCENIKNKHKINRIKVENNNGSIEYKPIQHHSNFKQYTYDYKLAQVCDGAMEHFIKFAYENFNKNCKKFIAINLVIKHKEKLKWDQEKRNKKKPVRHPNANHEFEESEDFVTKENERKESLETNDKVREYINLSIPELKAKLKEPSVLLKFYQAFLFECDWELLFIHLKKVLTTAYNYATMTKLLIYLIWNVTKVVCVANEREGQNRNLDIMLKRCEYREVINQLQMWTNNYKYSMYHLPEHKPICNINTKAYELRCFKELARNTKEIYVHITSVPVKLEVGEMDFPQIHTSIKYIEYTLDGCNRVIFDLIESKNTETNTKYNLDTSSWKERLDKLREIFLMVGRKEYIAPIVQTTKRIIQFDALPCGKSVCHYIRTSGLGGGTLFFSANNKKIRCTNMPNKRFRKITIDDLEDRKLDTNMDSDIEEPNPVHKIESDSMRFTQKQCQELLKPISNLICDIFLQSSNSITQQKQESLQSSPASSPTHELNLDYLGNLQITNGNANLKFAEFKEDDVI
ncbi:hypothetical protein CsNV_036 [Callinectes sapidus nudivirus]|nr:hypothetical protein CsNV_036 [Callinectes sapidus nudivirus]